MPSNNRYKTVETMVDEDFSPFSAGDTINAVGDLIANGAPLKAVDNSGNIAARLELVADAAPTSAIRANLEIADSAFSYGGLKLRTRFRVMDHGETENEFTRESYTIKVGQLVIRIDSGSSFAGVLTATVGPGGGDPPSQLEYDPQVATLTLARDEWIDIEGVYFATKGDQMEFRLTNSSGTEKISLHNVPLLTETLARFPGEIAISHDRSGQQAGGVVTTAIELDDVLIEKVDVGRPLTV